MSDLKHEPRLDPPDDNRSVTARCGHEVYAGEIIVHWKNAKGKTETICPDCFMDKVKEMTIQEVAEIFGCEHEEIGNA